MNKRSFIKGFALSGLAIPEISKAMASEIILPKKNNTIPLAEDENFWAGIRRLYKIKPDYINLESGYYNLLPEPTLDKYLSVIKEVNYHASFYMRTKQFAERSEKNKAIAAFTGSDPEELY